MIEPAAATIAPAACDASCAAPVGRTRGPRAAASRGGRVAEVLGRHFDPVRGTRFWLERAERLGIARPHRTLRTEADLARLGTMSPDDLRGRPLADLLPRSLHDRRREIAIVQTGGTGGTGAWTAYLPAELDEAFVAPFALAAHACGFPRGGTWLAACPSGPHVIGRAACAIARATGAAEPFLLDLDPRWFRALEEGSLVRSRYAAHVVAQAEAILAVEPVDVLFATPPLLLALAARMDEAARRRIRGVHYGGMAISAAERTTLEREAFPEAVHLSGYGNTLLGCLLELPGAAPLDHFPYGDRLRFDVRDDDGVPCPPGVRGRVHASRFDDSMLLVAMAERDEAALAAPPAGAPAGFARPGLSRPEPLAAQRRLAAAGLY